MKRLVAALCLLASPVWADMTELPRWHMTNGMACYSFEESKLLVLGDMRLVACGVMDASFGELRLAFSTMLESLDAKERALTLTQSKADDLKVQLGTCIDERARWEAKASSGPGWGWLVAGGVTLVLAGFLVGNQVLK